MYKIQFPKNSISPSPLFYAFIFGILISVLPVCSLLAQDDLEKKSPEKKAVNVTIEAINIDMGVLFLANEVYDTNEKDIGNPVINYTLGATLPIYFTKNFFLAPSLLFFTAIYSPSELSGLAMPTDSAEADTLTTFGMWIDVSAGYRFIFDGWTLGAQGGLAFLIRIPMWGPASDEQRDEIIEGLYEKGRFLYISTGVWVSILMTDKLDLIIRYKTEIPIFNTWSENDLTFLDQWGMNLTLGVAIHF